MIVSRFNCNDKDKRVITSDQIQQELHTTEFFQGNFILLMFSGYETVAYPLSQLQR